MRETRGTPRNEHPPRLTVDEAFDLTAFTMAGRGTCDRLRTATVIRDLRNHLIASGYNGSLPKDPECDEVGHLMVDGHCLRTNHGEENAILNCLDLSLAEKGIVTVVGTPCFNCARKLAALRPARIRYIGEYENAQGKEFVEELCARRGIAIEYVEPEEILRELQKLLDFHQGPGGLLRHLSKIRVVVGAHKNHKKEKR